MEKLLKIKIPSFQSKILQGQMTRDADPIVPTSILNHPFYQVRYTVQPKDMLLILYPYLLFYKNNIHRQKNMKRELKISGNTPQQQEDNLRKAIQSACRIPYKKKESFQQEVKQLELYNYPAIRQVKANLALIIQEDRMYNFKQIGSANFLTPRILITCAHCFFNLQENTFEKSIVTWKEDEDVRNKKIKGMRIFLPDQQQAKKVQKMSNNGEYIKQSPFCFQIQKVIISPKLLNGQDINSDWALILLSSQYDQWKYTNITNKGLQKLTVIHSKSIHDIPIDGLKGFYLGFYKEVRSAEEYSNNIPIGFYRVVKNTEDYNKYLPNSSFHFLNIRNGKVDHSMQTDPGSSGGALIYSLRIGINEYKYYLVGIHKKSLNVYDPSSKEKVGVLLDPSFPIEFGKLLQKKPVIPGDAQCQFLGLDDFSTVIINVRTKLRLYNQSQDKPCEVIIQFVKKVVELFNHYLYLHSNKKDYQFYERIKIVQNVDLQRFDPDIGFIPLRNLFEAQDYRDRINKWLQDDMNTMTRGAARDLIDILCHLELRRPQSDKFRNLIGSLIEIARRYPDAHDKLSIFLKLLQEYEQKSILKILKSQEKLLEYVQNNLQYRQNPIDFLVKTNSVNCIKILSYQLKHKYAQDGKYIPNLQKVISRLREQYVVRYKQLLNKWVDEQCKWRNIYFELQRSFPQQQEFQQINDAFYNERAMINMIMLNVYSEYYQGDDELNNLRQLDKGTKELFQEILNLIQGKIQKNVTKHLQDNFLLQLQQALNLGKYLKIHVRKEFIDICLLYHVEFQIKFNSLEYSTEKIRKEAQGLGWNTDRDQNLLRVKQFEAEISHLKDDIQVAKKKQIRYRSYPKKKDDHKKLQEDATKELELKETQLRQLRQKLSLQNLDDKIITLAKQYQQHNIQYKQLPDQFNQIPKGRRQSPPYIGDDKIYKDLKRYRKEDPENPLYWQDSEETKVAHSTLDKLSPLNPENHTYYDHIGVITVIEGQGSEAKYIGTGTVIGKSVVLTAFHVVAKLVELQRFVKGSLRFQLRGNNKGNNFDVVKIKFNKQFDWAILYCQGLIRDKSIFKLITHNSNIERSSFVQKSYFCEIIGFANDDNLTEKLSRSSGRIFIEEQYNKGFKYALSTTERMSGSPILIYPTGDYKSKSAYILGIHVQGSEYQTFRAKKKKYFDEVFNYGNKIILQQIGKSEERTAWEKDYISNGLRLVSIVQGSPEYMLKTVHQNSYQFSSYFYKKGKTDFIQSYYKSKGRVRKGDIQTKFFQEIIQMAKLGLIFTHLDPENILFQVKDKKQRLFVHRIVNPRVKYISRQYPTQKEYDDYEVKYKKDCQEYRNKSRQAFQKIFQEDSRQMEKSFILRGFDSSKLDRTGASVTTQPFPFKREQIISCLTAQECDIGKLNDYIHEFQSIIVKLGEQFTADKYYLDIFSSLRKQMIQILRQFQDPNYNIEEILQLFKQQFNQLIISEKKYELQVEYPQRDTKWFRRKSDDYIKNEAYKKFGLVIPDFLESVRFGSEVAFKAQPEIYFEEFVGFYYNDILALARKIFSISPIIVTLNNREKIADFLKDALKLLILKSTDDIRVLVDSFIHTTVPPKNYTFSTRSQQWENQFKIPKWDHKLDYQRYTEDFKNRMNLLKRIEIFENFDSRIKLIECVLNYKAISQNYIRGFRNDLDSRIKMNIKQSIIKVPKQVNDPVSSVSSDEMVRKVAKTYNFPGQEKWKSLLNLDRIILEEISLFSLLNYQSKLSIIEKNREDRGRDWVEYDSDPHHWDKIFKDRSHEKRIDFYIWRRLRKEIQFGSKPEATRVERSDIIRPFGLQEGSQDQFQYQL